MPKIVQFGSRDEANRIRSNPQFSGLLAETDDRRTATVELKENAPQPALNRIAGEAADSRQHEAEKYGQAPLSKSEKKRLDFSEANVLHARSVKAIARGKGVDDWTSFYDPRLSVDEHRGVMDQATQEGGGRSGLGRDRSSERSNIDRLSGAFHRQDAEELGHAKDHAFQGDREAQSFVENYGPMREVIDVGFNRQDNRLVGQGEDFDRLEERHESRSSRAQTLDEKQSAPVTRRPFEWVNHPDKYDYPGIDTVQPHELHEQRSERAQTIDEQEIAPVPETKQEWAMAPDRHDWPGIDRPKSYGPTMADPVPEEEIGRFPAGGLLEGTGLAPDDYEIGLTNDVPTSNRPGWGFESEEEIDFSEVDPRM